MMESMTCTAAQSLLQPYLDGSLEPAEARPLESHVAACPACRLELVQLERVMLAIESLPRLAASPAVLERAMARISSPSRQPAAWQHPRLVTLPASLAMLTLGIVLAGGAAGSAADLGSLLLDQDSPASLLEALVAMAASLETSLIVGIAIAFVAGCSTLMHLVLAGPETTRA